MKKISSLPIFIKQKKTSIKVCLSRGVQCKPEWFINIGTGTVLELLKLTGSEEHVFSLSCCVPAFLNNLSVSVIWNTVSISDFSSTTFLIKGNGTFLLVGKLQIGLQ